MTTTPPKQMLTNEQRSTLAAQHGFEYNPSGGVAGLIAAIERALLAKLREQQPVARILSLERGLGPILVWNATAERLFAGMSLYAAPVPTPAQAAQAVPAGWLDVCVFPPPIGVECWVRVRNRQGRYDGMTATWDGARWSRPNWIGIPGVSHYCLLPLPAAPTPTGAGDDINRGA